MSYASTSRAASAALTLPDRPRSEGYLDLDPMFVIMLARDAETVASLRVCPPDRRMFKVFRTRHSSTPILRLSFVVSSHGYIREIYYELYESVSTIRRQNDRANREIVLPTYLTHTCTHTESACIRACCFEKHESWQRCGMNGD